MSHNVAVVRAGYDKTMQDHVACLTRDSGNGRFESTIKFEGRSKAEVYRSLAKAANDAYPQDHQAVDVDALSQIRCTISHKYREAGNAEAKRPGPMEIYRHYQLVARDGHGLTSSYFGDVEKLLHFVRGGISGDCEAFQASILRSDVSDDSVSNQIEEGIEPRPSSRPGTWQFMSAHSLSNPGRPRRVEDEMESFFHLLLFCAIRYLRHNCRDVDAFITGHFNGSTQGADEDFCGLEKWNAMMDGRFALYRIAGPLTFYLPSENRPNSSKSASSSARPSSLPQEVAPKLHPINSLFSRLLLWLRAHYALANEPKDLPQGPHAFSTPVAAEQKEEPTEEERWFIEEYGMDEEDEDEDDEEGLGVDELSPEQRAAFIKLAPKLKEHKHVIGLFRRALSRSRPFGAWPRDDRVPDQLHSHRCESQSE